MPDRIRWSRVLLEGVVIVASILLAFGIDAWWSESQSRRNALLQLATVLEELEEGREEIETLGAWHERRLAGILSLQSELESVGVDETVSVADTLVSHLLSVAVTDAPTAVLDAFVSSGNLDEIQDEALRRQLLGWGSILDDLRDDEVRARDFLDSEVLPYLRAESDISRAMDFVNGMWLGGLDTARIQKTRLRSTASLRNLVAWEIGFFQLLGSQSHDAIVHLEQLATLARRELS